MDPVTVNGIVLKRRAVGDYDFAVTLLTAESGKISAFARGARRMGNALLGSVEPFCTGSFNLYPGRTSFSIRSASITNYFEAFRTDLEASCYGTFFLEIADYYTRENSADRELLNLLYVTLRALERKDFDRRLVRCVFELRSLVIEGEYPGPPEGGRWLPDTLYALRFLTETPLNRLYTFTVSDAVLKELMDITKTLRGRFMDRKPRSLEMIATFE